MNSAESHYLLIGRKGTGGVFDRLPIQTLQDDHPYQFSLFILAFNAILQRPGAFVDVEPAATFMEIASIHGKPYVEWAGDRNKDTSADYSAKDKKDTNPVPSRFGGYCNHGSVVFPTWHRPYVMLLEQSIGNVAEKLALDIETKNPGEKGKWVKAAHELRFPYWDWAGKEVIKNGLPAVLYEEKVTIQAIGDGKQTVDNPLSFFSYVGGVPSDFTDEIDTQTKKVARFSKWTRTYRYPTGTVDPEHSQIELLQKEFKEKAQNLRTAVGHLFAHGHDEDPALAWDDFSNHTGESKRASKDYRNLGSLESVHDSVHDLLGGNGHMSWPDYAGFDPIFFLHHSNVDRLMALWEWCYPSYWMGNEYVHKGKYPWTQARGTYSQVYNEQLLPDGPLQPFRTEKGEYWTSSQARSLDKDAYPKYYSFPEFEGIKVDQAAKTPEERESARQRVQVYYEFNPKLEAKQVTSHAWKHFPVPNKEDPAVPSDHTVIPHYRTFIVHVKLLEHAYNRTYSFQLHHKGNAYSDPQFVGTVTVFTRPDYSPCKACAVRREAGSIVRGMIPIPPQLIESIIKSNGGGDSGTTFSQTLAHIKGEFVGKLVDSAGSELAGAEGGLEAPQVPQHRAASDKVTPIEISLVSAAVAEHVEDKDRPVYLCDWQHHEAVFNSGWLATHGDSV